MQDHGLPADVVEAAAGGVREVRQRGGAGDPRRRPEPPGHLDRRLHPAPGRTTRPTPRRWTCSRSTPTARSAPSSRTGSTAATPSRTSSPRADRTASGRCPTTSTACPNEPTDLQKRARYTASWNAIKGHPGVALGATEFHYGLENDFGGVWLNTTTGGWRRLGYHALRQAYTGQAVGEHPAGDHRDDGRLADRRPGRAARSPSTVAATDPHGDLIRYNLMFSNKHITGNRGLDNVRFTQTGTGRFTVTAPEQLGRVEGLRLRLRRAGQRRHRAEVVQGRPADGRRAPTWRPGKPATASTYQPTGDQRPAAAGRTPSTATTRTRWASEWVDTAWIQVDLGSVHDVQPRPARLGGGVRARPTRSRPPTTAPTGRTVYSTTAGNGGFDDLDAQRLRPVRPDERHRARHRVRLLPLGVRRLPADADRSQVRRVEASTPRAPPATVRPRFGRES